MRKNAINQQWTPLDGGIEAVDGVYCASAALSCSQTLLSASTQNFLTVISSSARCVAACVFPDAAVVDAHTLLTKNNVKSGYIKALLLSDGCEMDAELLPQTKIKADFRLFADALRCNAKEVCAVNIGKVGSRFVSVSKEQLQTLLATRDAGQTQTVFQQFAYTFHLGDVVCSMGAMFIDGASHETQTGAQSTVCCLVTDVCITPQMLEKAFASAVEDTLKPLYLGVDRSPNDCYAILSTCKAGNYCISETDSEYKKLVNALKHTLEEIAERITKNEPGKRLLCLVESAKSKQAAKSLVDAMLFSSLLRSQAHSGDIKTETLLCALCGAGERIALDRAQIYLRSELGEIALWDYGKQTSVEQARIAQIASAKDVYLEVRLHDGNYKAKGIAKIAL